MKKILIPFCFLLMYGLIFSQTNKEIKTSALPKCVTEWLNKNLGNYNIEKTTMVVLKGETIYYLHIQPLYPNQTRTGGGPRINPLKPKPKAWYRFDNTCQNVKIVDDSELDKMKSVNPAVERKPASKGNSPQPVQPKK